MIVVHIHTVGAPKQHAGRPRSVRTFGGIEAVRDYIVIDRGITRQPRHLTQVPTGSDPHAVPTTWVRDAAMVYTVSDASVNFDASFDSAAIHFYVICTLYQQCRRCRRRTDER
jgi:hypothetical protein